MLIKCPECELQVSDKALACPHCGYPLKSDTQPRKPRKAHKKRRLPNGFGQISEIKGRNLRKPFRAMVTVSKGADGRPICKPLKPEAYFATYNEAYAALVEYNRSPYDLQPTITMQELYNRWSEEHYKNLASSTVATFTNAWKYCSEIYNVQVADIRARHIKGCMENGTYFANGREHKPTEATKTKIKSLFNLLLDYAVEYELVEKNFARNFNMKGPSQTSYDAKTPHIPFSEKELEKLWGSVEKEKYADILLIQCYSGWRPKELGLLRLENINLNEWSFKGGVKTSAGIDRTVPIHSKIRPLVLRRYKEAQALHSEYLFNWIGCHQANTQLSYERYKNEFEKIRDSLNLDPHHRPHDGRKTFVTLAKKYNVDEYAIKYMAGHAISDLTERVYTQRDFEWLRKEIEKIK